LLFNEAEKVIIAKNNKRRQKAINELRALTSKKYELGDFVQQQNQLDWQIEAKMQFFNTENVEGDREIYKALKQLRIELRKNE
jgi:hypothetical protein